LTLRLLARSLLTGLALLALPAAASAAEPIPVEAAEIGEWRAKGPVRDTVLPPGVRARTAAARTEEFVDVGGHVIAVTTAVPELDLMPYAQVVAWLIHFDEIEDVTLEVVAPERISEVCGAEALACYQPASPGISPAGWIWIPSVHEDVVHLIAHEYGHHVDNQLTNLAGIRSGCEVSSDGSRNWFFERDADDGLFDAGLGCAGGAEWSHQLSELFAEDYTWLNGNRVWRPDMLVRSPGEWHLEALASDLAVPFETRSKRYSKHVDSGESRIVKVKLEHWTFFTAELTGRRRADLDLFLRKAHGRRALERSRGAGSHEEVERLLPPGEYEVEVLADADGGRGKLRLDFD
jgi:hypothetical protein